MRGAHALLALATAILCVPLEAAAQEAQPPPGASSPVGNVGTRLYLHGGLNSRVLPEGLANHRVSPPLAGWAHDWFAAVGRFVSPNVSLEGEVVAGGTVSAPQRFSYLQSSDYTAEVRDIWLVANVVKSMGFKDAKLDCPEILLVNSLDYWRHLHRSVKEKIT